MGVALRRQVDDRRPRPAPKSGIRASPTRDSRAAARVGEHGSAPRRAHRRPPAPSTSSQTRCARGGGAPGRGSEPRAAAAGPRAGTSGAHVTAIVGARLTSASHASGHRQLSRVVAPAACLPVVLAPAAGLPGVLAPRAGLPGVLAPAAGLPAVVAPAAGLPGRLGLVPVLPGRAGPGAAGPGRVLPGAVDELVAGPGAAVPGAAVPGRPAGGRRPPRWRRPRAGPGRRCSPSSTAAGCRGRRRAAPPRAASSEPRPLEKGSVGRRSRVSRGRGGHGGQDVGRRRRPWPGCVAGQRPGGAT